MPMDNNHPGNPTFMPLWQAGQSVRLFKGSEDNHIDVTIKHVFGLPWHRHNFGILTADSTDNDCTHLDMQDGYMAQYRFIPRSSVDVHLQHPGGVDIFRTNGSTKGGATTGWFVHGYDQEGEQWDGHDWHQWAASEFVVFEDETPRFDLYPTAPSESLPAHVDFYGWAYALKRFSPSQGGAMPPATYWVNGRPAGENLTSNK